MRARGINYDTGFLPGDENTRKVFTVDTVRHEMDVIANQLHCQAVRVSGADPERLGIAAELAAAAGLEVWFAPFPVDEQPAQMLALYADCARRAEAVRAGGAEVVFVAGCESSAFGAGFMPGDTYRDRLQTMTTAGVSFWQSLGEIIKQLNDFLAEAAATVRAEFAGKVTYAAGPWEFIDWGPFDYVGVDAYRAAYNAENFRQEVRDHAKHGKPVAVTEFGTCAYQGAGELGGMAWVPPEGAVPDESEQVRYFTELSDIFDEEGVDTALWFTFASFKAVGADDLKSYGVVRMLDATSWEPKAVFHAMAARYAR